MREYIVGEDSYSYEMRRYEELEELIRCKDCKYSVDEYDDGDCYCDYNRNLNYIGKNWNHYCGWAERGTE